MKSHVVFIPTVIFINVLCEHFLDFEYVFTRVILYNHKYYITHFKEAPSRLLEELHNGFE